MSRRWASLENGPTTWRSRPLPLLSTCTFASGRLTIPTCSHHEPTTRRTTISAKRLIGGQSTLPTMYVFLTDPSPSGVLILSQTWEHYSSVRNAAGPHSGEPNVKFSEERLSKKRPSPSVDGEHDDQASRTQKRRSPLHLFDSDSTPEGSETSSDESSGVLSSFQQSQQVIPKTSMVRSTLR